MRVMLAKPSSKARRNVILAVVLLLIPVAFLTVAALYIADIRSKAAVTNPQRILAGNIASNSASIAWTTPGGKTVAAIEWGETESLGRTEVDYRNKTANKSDSRETHFVQLDNLQPDKEYYYRIKMAGQVFPAEDQDPYSFKTLPLKTQSTAQAVSIYGQLDGDAPADSLVVAYVASAGNESLPLIAYPKQDGSWYLNIAQATPKTGTQALVITEKNPVTILFDGGENGALVKTRAEDAPLNVTLKNDFTPEEIYDLLAENRGVPTQTVSAPLLTPMATISTTPSVSVSVTPSTTVAATPITTPTRLNGSIDFGTLRQDVVLKTGVTKPSTLGEKSNTAQENIQLSLYSSPTQTNVTDSSISFFWVTKDKETTQVVYGANQATSSEKVFDDRDGSGSPKEYFVHQVTLKKLSAGASYSYIYGKTSISSSFTIPQPLQLQPAFQNISGKITGSSGECIMKTQLQRGETKSSPISTIVTPDAAWLLNIGPVRSGDLKSYFSASATDTLIFDAVCVQGQDSFKTGNLTTTVNKAISEGITIQMK